MKKTLLKLPKTRRWPPVVNNSVQLTDAETTMIQEVVTRIVRRIVRREPNLLRRRVLKECIPTEAALAAAAEFGAIELRLRKKFSKNLQKLNI